MSGFHASRNRLSLLLSGLVTSVLVASCERPAPVLSPTDEVAPQAAITAALSNLQFHVTRSDNGAPVRYATISAYLDPDATTPPTLCASGDSVVGRNCWLITDSLGNANIYVPTGGGVAYLARLLPPEWLNFAGLVMPPLDPGATLTTVANDLGALTCGRRAPEAFTPGRFSQCLNNLFLVPRGPSEIVELVLPVVNTRTVTVKDLEGNVVTSGVHAYLIEGLQSAEPWQTLPQGVKPGFLRFFGAPGTAFPGSGGFVEIYGSKDGFEIAGTLPVTAGGGTTTVETSPVICANGTENVDYSISRSATNSLFSFVDAKYAFAAIRGAINALDKDLTTTVLVLNFQQNGGPFTVDINQRHRTAGGTTTASATLQCTNGVCDVANALINVPGANNPMVPHLYHPKAGKLVWVVQGLDPQAVSEWAAKASNGNVLIEQIPVASKKDASSAFKLFAKGFTFCHPDFSFDGGWGCSI